MTSPEWWAASKRPATPTETLRRQSGRIWTVTRNDHHVSLDVRLIEFLGAEIVLSVNGELRRARFYHRLRVLDLIDAVIETERRLTAAGWLLQKDTNLMRERPETIHFN